jgi:hypothetical protein
MAYKEDSNSQPKYDDNVVEQRYLHILINPLNLLARRDGPSFAMWVSE